MKKILLLSILFALQVFIFGQENVNKTNTENIKIKFEPKMIRSFENLPIQIEGRVKPLNTVASVLLLKINGKRVVRDGTAKYNPMEWLLLLWFYPQIANEQKVFLVDNNEVLENFGFHDVKARDRYSFNQLAPILENIFEKADQITKKDKEKRLLLENQTLALATSLKEYLVTAHTFDGFRPMPKISQLGIEENIAPRRIRLTINATKQKISEFPKMQALSKEDQKVILEELDNVSATADQFLQFSEWLKIFPSMNTNEKWHSLYDIAILNTNVENFDSNKICQTIEDTIKDLLPDGSNVSALHPIAINLHEQIDSHPTTKSYASKIALEVNYYSWDLIYKSLILFVLLFLSISFSFLNSNQKTWYKINIISMFAPIFLLCLAIIMRCTILGRPPVATLYETVIFITAIVCIVAIYIEGIFKNKLAIYAAAIMGSGGLFLSYRYEISEGADTMGNLAAVLNSNFWLSTHVTAITIGYSAGLLAALFAHIYLFAKVFRTTTDNKFYSELKKIIYGVICFCTVFSTVGTILGGIWANYSWGRFWGWDPKENGALAIVLWCLLILHARMGGIIREFGLIILTVIGGMVVVASWWGVNQLNVGLHSYGFTNGAKKSLLIFAVVECTVIFIALIHHYFIEPRTKTPSES